MSTLILDTFIIGCTIREKQFHSRSSLHSRVKSCTIFVMVSVMEVKLNGRGDCVILENKVPLMVCILGAYHGYWSLRSVTWSWISRKYSKRNTYIILGAAAKFAVYLVQSSNSLARVRVRCPGTNASRACGHSIMYVSSNSRRWSASLVSAGPAKIDKQVNPISPMVTKWC